MAESVELPVDTCNDPEDSDADTDSSGEDRSGPSKRAKVTKWKGAAVYKSKFQKSWTQKWPCIVAVTGKPHEFKCTICCRQLSCAHMGIADVERHLEKDIHLKNAKAAKSQPTLNFVSSTSALSDQVSC